MPKKGMAAIEDARQESFDRTTVPAVVRALRVLELLAGSKRGFNISEASRKLGLPKSSTHRILMTLDRDGCVHRDTHTGRYRFGTKLVTLSRSALESLEVREEARPFLVSLMQKTGMTVHMAILESGQAIIIEKIEAPGIVKIGTWIGRAMDVNSTAAGKALVAFLPQDEFDRQIKARAFVRHNQKTIVSLGKLKDELAQVRQSGFAVDDEEDEIGVRCVGAPIFDDAGRVAAAISVVGTTAQVPGERIRELGAIVRQFADGISLHLGYGGTTTKS